MYTNLNPRTMGLNHHDFNSLLLSAYKHGFKGIEVPAGAFDTPKMAAEAAKRMEDLNMRFGLIMAPCDMYKVDDKEFEQSLKTFEKWAKLARIAGCTRAYNHVWPGSNERTYEENFQWHIKRLKAIYKILRDNGINYGLEFMGPKTIRNNFKYEFIHSLIGVLSLTSEVNSSIGFVFDTIHWYCSGGNMDDLYYASMHPEKIINLHICDATTTRDNQIDSIRAMPMETGIIDSVSILRLLDKSGYDGPVIIEPMKPTTDIYANMELDDAVHDAITKLHAIFSLAGVEDC